MNRLNIAQRRYSASYLEERLRRLALDANVNLGEREVDVEVLHLELLLAKVPHLFRPVFLSN